MEEEDVLEFQDSKQSELLTFVKEVIKTTIANELTYEHNSDPLSHATTYGVC